MLEVATVLGVVGWRAELFLWASWVKEKQKAKWCDDKKKEEILGKMSTRLVSLSVAAGPINTPDEKNI